MRVEITFAEENKLMRRVCAQHEIHSKMKKILEEMDTLTEYEFGWQMEGKGPSIKAVRKLATLFDRFDTLAEKLAEGAIDGENGKMARDFADQAVARYAEHKKGKKS